MGTYGAVGEEREEEHVQEKGRMAWMPVNNGFRRVRPTEQGVRGSGVGFGTVTRRTGAVPALRAHCVGTAPLEGAGAGRASALD